MTLSAQAKQARELARMQDDAYRRSHGIDAVRTAEITMVCQDAADRADLGTATARKTGRNPRWPYVPIVQHSTGGVRGDGYVEQIKGLAYETRDEAVDAASRAIAKWRTDLAVKLARPGYRALREDHGLPRELEDVR